MRVILDTHTFLWWNIGDQRLSALARAAIADGRNEVLVSVASIWEVAIKAAKGKLDLPDDPESYVADRMRRNRWLALPIDERHALRAATLPMIHADPFDRVLIAQAQLESLAILTTDPAITRYDVETIW